MGQRRGWQDRSKVLLGWIAFAAPLLLLLGVGVLDKWLPGVVALSIMGLLWLGVLCLLLLGAAWEDMTRRAPAVLIGSLLAIVAYALALELIWPAGEDSLFDPGQFGVLFVMFVGAGLTALMLVVAAIQGVIHLAGRASGRAGSD